MDNEHASAHVSPAGSLHPSPDISPRSSQHSAHVPNYITSPQGTPFIPQPFPQAYYSQANTQPHAFPTGYPSAYPAPYVQPSQTGILPDRQSKYVLKTFHGSHRRVKQFIEQFEALCISHHVFTDAARCSGILRYCSDKVRDTIEAMDSYAIHDWDSLNREILKAFDADRHEKRYQPSDVKAFVRKMRHRKMRNLSEWRQYLLKFNTKAGWVYKNGRMTRRQINLQLWQGICPTLHKRIEQCLINWHPTHNMANPWDKTDVDKAAEFLLARGTFHEDLSDPYSEDESGWSEDTNTDSEAISSDDEYPAEEPTKYDKSRHKKGETRKPAVSSAKVSAYPRRKVRPQNTDGVEDLVMQLGSLKINEPRYAILHYQICRIDEKWPRNYQVAPVAQDTRPNITSMPRPLPPHMSNTAPPRPTGCYGCGEQGHSMNICPKLAGLVTQGKVVRDANGRYTFPDGSIIRHTTGETLVQAATRDRGKASTFNSNPVHANLVRDSEDEEYEPRPVHSYKAEHGKKTTREARENVDEQISIRRHPPTRNNPTSAPKGSEPVSNPEEPTRSQLSELPERPIDVFPQTFDPTNEDAFMDDVEDRPRKQVRISSPVVEEIIREPADLLQSRTRKVPTRQSTISKVADPRQVLAHILGTSVSLPIGDILGVSRELGSLLVENMKLKSINLTSLGLTAISPWSTVLHDRLLQFQVNINGALMTAIMDSGSQLNIIRRELADKFVCLPMDRQSVVRMTDANGGEEKLVSLIQDVRIHFGALETHAHLWAADHVPFDLLLGQPWQRDNLVCIDERKAGTYLVFKDKQNPDRIRYDVMLQGHNVATQNIQQFMARTEEEETDAVNLVRLRVEQHQ
ncbi:hypothetical protein OF83DRAFT_1070057 [Amylostereum chailletii]|nr:hypothetical protein OF83DRAFT_1070057 [Amylostereum chailletii]